MNSLRDAVSPRPELLAYEAALPQIVGEHKGEFVVIHGSQLFDFFQTYDKALDWAYARFGLEPFFVKQVALQERVAHFTRDLGPCRK